MRPAWFLIAGLSLWVGTVGVAAQRADAFLLSRDHPAIKYSTSAATDPIAALNAKLDSGQVRLTFDPVSGYLRSVLAALNISPTSQLLVHSPTSAQADRISFLKPRALYFNDTAAVGWVKGTEVLEVVGQDPRLGSVFYTLPQTASGRPRFARDNSCLECHLTWDTLAVPAPTATSMYPLRDEKAYANGFTTEQRSPMNERWGGWFVTGRHGGAKHMGNLPVQPADKGKSKITTPTAPLDSVTGLIDLAGFPTPYSDVVALLVFNHQTLMHSYITRIGWEARVAEQQRENLPRIRQAAADLVDYMLFIDEAPLAGRVQGTSGFAEQFARLGPRDSKGRSLRDFDLVTRTFKYPCSYLIYSEPFNALPLAAKNAVYDRLGDILTGRVTDAKYARVSAADRQAILEILRETKRDLPPSMR